jgi:hypothetical protein
MPKLRRPATWFSFFDMFLGEISAGDIYVEKRIYVDSTFGLEIREALSVTTARPGLLRKAQSDDTDSENTKRQGSESSFHSYCRE